MEISEKLVFLKREEIKTMAKDLARLQEEEAIREKERISRLKVEEKLKRETLAREEIASTIIPREAGIKEKKIETESLLPKALSSSALEKVLIRAIVVFLLLAFFVLITFGCWLLVIKGRNQPMPSPSSSLSPSPSELPSLPATPSPAPSLEPAPIIPASIVPVKETKILEISPDHGLSELLEETIKTTASESKSPEFFQLAIEKDKAFLGAGEFLKELALLAPDDLLKAVSGETEDFTLLLYAKKEEPRLGLVVRVPDSSLANDAARAWEATMEKDFENFFLPQGKKASPAGGAFREAKYQDGSFRYLSFAEKNLGICWTVYDNYFILTSSGEGLVRTIDLLKKL